MRTSVFVEKPEDSGKMIVGFQLSRNNYYYSPKGIIRIARFKTGFSPKKNLGYYGDIYMKNFVKKWKHYNYIKKVQIILEEIFCFGLNKVIAEFL
jgi:hypothetical protein